MAGEFRRRLRAIATTSRPSPFSPTPAREVAVRCPAAQSTPRPRPYMHDGRFAGLDQVLDHYESLAVDPAADHDCGARH